MFLLSFNRGHLILPELHLSCNSKKFIHEFGEVKVQFLVNELNFSCSYNQRELNFN